MPGSNRAHRKSVRGTLGRSLKRQAARRQALLPGLSKELASARRECDAAKRKSNQHMIAANSWNKAAEKYQKEVEKHKKEAETYKKEAAAAKKEERSAHARPEQGVKLLMRRAGAQTARKDPPRRRIRRRPEQVGKLLYDRHPPTCAVEIRTLPSPRRPEPVVKGLSRSTEFYEARPDLGTS